MLYNSLVFDISLVAISVLIAIEVRRRVQDPERSWRLWILCVSALCGWSLMIATLLGPFGDSQISRFIVLWAYAAPVVMILCGPTECVRGVLSLRLSGLDGLWSIAAGYCAFRLLSERFP